MSMNQTAERDALILKWQEADKMLKHYKKAESELRKQVIEANFGEHEGLRKGTENEELGKGFKLKAVFKTNMSFQGGTPAVIAALDKIIANDDEGKFIAKRLVKWSPELSVSEYNKLSPHLRNIIDGVIVTKQASTTLELVTPKE